MDKNILKFKRREDNNRAVQKWLQEAPNLKKGMGRLIEQSRDVGNNIPGTVTETIVPNAEQPEIDRRPVNQENVKNCQSYQSDTEAEQVSVDNAIPRVVLLTTCTKGRKHVQFDNHANPADETVQLQTSMTNFLSMKGNQRNERKERKCQRSSRYIVSPSRSDDAILNELPIQNDVKDIFLQDFSNHVVANDQPVIRSSIASRQHTCIREEIPSVMSYKISMSHQNRGFGWKPNTKRKTSGAKLQCLPSNGSGLLEYQTPVIRGLVVDTVENQKPSIVRASKNANIREEFALKQKVESYRNACTNNISTINHAQRKLGANLMYLKNRLRIFAANSKSHSAQGRTLTGVDRQNEMRARSEPVELFVQSKGYVPETTTPSKVYSFPALIYPKRRSLTIKQSV